jgi:1,4-dihydroxy-2-naphthoate octaprenyltransferase
MIVDMLILILVVAAFIVCAYTINQTINYLQALSDPERGSDEKDLQALLGVVYPTQDKTND